MGFGLAGLLYDRPPPLHRSASSTLLPTVLCGVPWMPATSIGISHWNFEATPSG